MEQNLDSGEDVWKRNDGHLLWMELFGIIIIMSEAKKG